MRISILTDTFYPEINGVALTVAHLANGLGARGHDVEVIRPRPRHPAGDAGLPRHQSDRAAGYVERTIPGLPLPGYSGLRFALPAQGFLRRHWGAARPDAVYLATEGLMGRSAIAIAGAMGIPVASGYHTRFAQYMRNYGAPLLEPFARRYLRRFHNQTECTLVPTQRLMAQLLERGYRKVYKLGRGIDTGIFSPRKRNAWLRQQWGAGSNDVVALYVGRIAPEKNLPLALDTFRRLRERHPGMKMVVVGDGPSAASLGRRYPEVIWAGQKNGEILSAFYASADLFLFPSETETYGNVVLEALASGLVTVAFEDAAAAELIVDGRSGFLAPLGDHFAFPNTVRRALAVQESWPQVRSRALASASSLSWESITSTFESHLLRIVQPAQRSGEADRFGFGAEISYLGQRL